MSVLDFLDKHFAGICLTVIIVIYAITNAWRDRGGS